MAIVQPSLTFLEMIVIAADAAAGAGAEPPSLSSSRLPLPPRQGFKEEPSSVGRAPYLSARSPNPMYTNDRTVHSPAGAFVLFSAHLRHPPAFLPDRGLKKRIGDCRDRYGLIPDIVTVPVQDTDFRPSEASTSREPYLKKQKGGAPVWREVVRTGADTAAPDLASCPPLALGIRIEIKLAAAPFTPPSVARRNLLIFLFNAWFWF
ncbi:hypothetical protein B0H12DRAFT_1215932 [Mycena haematopus]|nr:hypothetical protein B0H12DRAFT_1215932 [Mycena haematopus]